MAKCRCFRCKERLKEWEQRSDPRARAFYTVSIQTALKRFARKGLVGGNNKYVPSYINLLGCSIEDFKIYIESKFEPEMNWENMGRNGWHLDHIMPCAIFDLKHYEHRKRCFHFSNYQPLWEVDNLRKSDTAPLGQIALI